MNIRRLSLRFGLFICFVLFVPFRTVHADEGTIEGVVKIILKENTIAYGDWIRVLLVREKVALPEIEDMSNLKKYERIDNVISVHMGFYKRVMEKMNDTEYIVATTLTCPDGTFKFPKIVSGQYYVVVTFPSMIRGYKVAWQLPVTVIAGKTTHIELSNKNYVLPTYCRD